MVFYSIKSNEKVFHLPHCKIARRIRKQYKKKFATPEEARAAGYRMCNCCSPVGMRLRKEQKSVNQFCKENGVSCRLNDGQLHIRTSRSKWRIIVGGKENKLFLYHKNTYHKYIELPGIIQGYHSQNTRNKTIVGYLEYIVGHDAFRKQQDKKDKEKSKSVHKPRKITRPYHRSTDSLRYNANQLYSIMENIDSYCEASQ